MDENAQKPVVFLATANSYDAGRRLKYLVTERRTIANILDTSGNCEVIQEGNASIDFFFDEIRRPKYKDRIAIIHFAGHADGPHLRFESESGEEQPMDPDAFASFLKTIDGIHLVFLNGCGTKPIVEKLLEAGIPAIIATERAIEDEKAAKVAEEFYQGLANGYSIEKSFDQAEAIAKATQGITFGKFSVELGEVNRGFHFPGSETQEGNSFPWGLYTLDSAAEHLSWKLTDQEGKISRLRTLTVPGTKFQLSLKSVLLGAGIALFLAAGVFLGIKYFPNKKPEGLTIEETVLGVFQDPRKLGRVQNTFIGSPNTYTCLLLPIIPTNQQHTLKIDEIVGKTIKNYKFEDSLQVRVIGRDALCAKDNLGQFKIDSIHTRNELLTYRLADQMADHLGIDMIIWGEYIFDKSKSDRISKLSLFYAFGKETRFGEDKIFSGFDEFKETLENVVNDELEDEIQQKRAFDVLNLATAQKLRLMGAFKEAGDYLKKLVFGGEDIAALELMIDAENLNIQSDVGISMASKKEIGQLLETIRMKNLDPVGNKENIQASKITDEKFWMLLATLYQYHGGKSWEYRQKDLKLSNIQRWIRAQRAFDHYGTVSKKKTSEFHFHRGRLNLYGIGDGAVWSSRSLWDTLRAERGDYILGFPNKRSWDSTRHSDAIKDFEQIIAAFEADQLPEDYDVAYHDLGLLYLHKLGNVKKAKSYFKKLIDRQEKFDKKNPHVYFDYAWALRMENASLDSIMHYYVKAPESIVTRSTEIKSWTRSLHENDQPEKIIEILTQLSETNNSPDFYKNFIPDSLVARYHPTTE